MADSRIAIIMHVGGVMKFGRVVRYEGGKSLKFDAVDCDKVAYFTLLHLAKEMGYTSDRIWYVLPGNSLSTGLREILSDKEVSVMVPLASRNGYINVYVEGSQNASIYRRKNDAIGRVNVDDDMGLDLEGSDPAELDGQISPVERSNEGSDGSNEVCCHINDSLSVETDDNEIGVAMTRQARVRLEQVVVNKDIGENSDLRESGDDMMTPEGSNEEVTKKRGRSHTSVRFDPNYDPEDLVFAVGLVFDSEDHFKETVQDYAVYNRVNIHFVRSSTKSVEAKCVDGCPWRVRASWLQRKRYFVVERSDIEHRCINSRANEYVLQPREVEKMWPESRGGPVEPPPVKTQLNREKNYRKKDKGEELMKPESLSIERSEIKCDQCFQHGPSKRTCQNAPAPRLDSQPAASQDQMTSVEPASLPSDRTRLLGLRKKSEVRRGGANISGRIKSSRRPYLKRCTRGLTC